MRIKELKQDHPRIYELAMLRQKEAGNEANEDSEIGDDVNQGGFRWSVTREKWDFWNEISSRNFDAFYQKYPHTNDLPLINPNMLDPDTEQDLAREEIEQDEAESAVDEVCKKHGLTAQINWNVDTSALKGFNPMTGRKIDDPKEIDWASKWQPAEEPINWNKITENYNKVEDLIKERTAKSTATFQSITASLGDLLAYKNAKYGNSALEPLNIFGNKSKVGQRLDDKLSRVQNSPTLRKNDVADIIGYLILVCQENNWTNFDEFKD